MINIKIICVGKMKEKAMIEVLQEYIKKLSKFAKLDIIELSDEKIPDNASKSDEEKIKNIECEKIIYNLNKIGKTYVFVCDINGKAYNSIELSKKIENTFLENSTITFIIGGSLGINNDLKLRANDLISFSNLTFPHQLFRIFLVEQIYRSLK